jgi:hypothetical protein
MTFDTTNYRPYPIDSQTITFESTVTTSRMLSTYRLSFTAPVPMVQRGTSAQRGCYVKVTFPKEVYLDDSLTVRGEFAMKDANNGFAPTVAVKSVTGS